MCEFLSAIGFKNGDVLCNPNIDSHEDLIKMCELKESKMRNWVRLEYSPANNDYHLLKKYELHIDDDIALWINDVLKEKWTNKLKAKVNNLIIKEPRHILSGGTYIISDGVTIEKTFNCRIIQMRGNSTIKIMRGNAAINVMWENATVNEMRDYASVNEMWENATINAMWENATVNEMWDYATVNEMRENATINVMRENATVNAMRENATVNEMWENATVNEMRDYASVNEMRDYASVNVKYN